MRAAATSLLALTAVLAGCGADTSYHNEPRPPEPLIVSASITDRAVSLSPGAFGGGPITIVITNQSSRPRHLTVETTGPDAGITHHSASVAPGDTTTMKLLTAPGRYTARASGKNGRDTRLLIATERPTSQNDLLQP